ncbi:hypothetical protein RQP46_001321 [Phenoliferia psychrophenolica]
MYGGWKSLEWGLVRDMSVYEWVGADGKLKVEGAEKAAEGVDRRKEAQGAAAGDVEAARPGGIRIVLGTLRLLTSMRGTGYAFSVTRSRRRPPVRRRTFILRTLLTLVWAHAVLVTCSIIISTPYPMRMAIGNHLLPQLSRSHLHLLVESTSYVALALGAWTGILVPATLINLLSSSLHIIAATLPLPPSRSFHFLAYDPVERLVRPFVGRNAAKAAGAMAVFAFSAVIHEYAIWCATSGLSPPIPRTTFLERFGAASFFLLMGALGIAEGIFTRLTGVRIRGVGAFLWTSSLQSIVGVLLYRSWANLGFTSSLPTVNEWEWQRWVVPLASLAPKPLWAHRGA